MSNEQKRDAAATRTLPADKSSDGQTQQPDGRTEFLTCDVSVADANGLFPPCKE